MALTLVLSARLAFSNSEKCRQKLQLRCTLSVSCSLHLVRKVFFFLFCILYALMETAEICVGEVKSLKFVVHRNGLGVAAGYCGRILVLCVVKE